MALSRCHTYFYGSLKPQMPKTGRIPESPEVPDILVSDALSLTLQTFSLCCPLTRKTFGRRCPEVPNSRTRGREIRSVKMPLATVPGSCSATWTRSCPKTCHSHFPCSQCSFRSPLLESHGTTWSGTPAHLLVATPCPLCPLSSLSTLSILSTCAACSRSLLRTPVPLCVSLEGATLQTSRKVVPWSREPTYKPTNLVKTHLGARHLPPTIAVHCHSFHHLKDYLSYLIHNCHSLVVNVNLHQYPSK